MPAIAINKSAACSGGYGQITVSFSAINIDDYSITLTGNITGESHISPYYTGSSGNSFTFNNLPNDTWTIEVTGASGSSASTTATTSCVPVGPVNDLSFQATGANPAAIGATDGQVSLSVSTSNQPFKTKLDAGTFTTGKTLYVGLGAGTYLVTVEDGAGFSAQQSVTLTDPAAPVLGCMDPNADNYDPDATEDNGTCVYPKPAPFFLVPLANSLRFVVEVTANNCSTFATLDNQLFCKQKTGNYNPGYFQKVANCDVLTFQFRSNYASHVIKLRNHTTGAPVGSDLAHDLKVAKVSAREFTLDCSGLPAGRYYLSIAATDPDYPAVTAVSEPFHVKAEHENTHLVTYRHPVNKFDVVYATGITNQVRVESHFYKRRPAGETSVMRDCNDNLVLLSSSARRRVLFEAIKLPDWLHEKLFVAFKHGEIFINGVQFLAEEPYNFEYISRFALADGSVALEQKGWFTGDNANGAEIGNSNSGYLLANNGYLEVTI